jgi:hypothetical protein
MKRKIVRDVNLDKCNDFAQRVLLPNRQNRQLGGSVQYFDKIYDYRADLYSPIFTILPILRMTLKEMTKMEQIIYAQPTLFYLTLQY